MGTIWETADVNSGGSTHSDQGQATRRSRRMSQTRQTFTGNLDHYAEKAEAREAARRETEDYQDSVKYSHEWRDRHAAGERFDRDNPKPRTTTPDAPDFLERMSEQDAWQRRRDDYLMRAEGEEIAARISR
ncbi:hypothetical protein [Streptomyces sp. NPDC055210]